MFKQLDLCSGVGAGFPLAGVQIGSFRLISLCEIDSSCREILKLRYPGVPIFNDIRKWPKQDIAIDIITASPPCQPFSIAGKRRAAADERNVIPAVIDVIGKQQPNYIALENVPGLLNCPYHPSDDRPYFQFLLERLYQLGYDAEWAVIPSRAFGTPWRGSRLLLVATAHRLKLSWEGATPWEKQIRDRCREAWNLAKERSLQPRTAR